MLQQVTLRGHVKGTDNFLFQNAAKQCQKGLRSLFCCLTHENRNNSRMCLFMPNTTMIGATDGTNSTRHFCCWPAQCARHGDPSPRVDGASVGAAGRISRGEGQSHCPSPGDK